MMGEPVVLSGETRGQEAAPVTVLLHSLALDRHVWEPAVDQFTRFGQVVLLDLRGHGRSPASTAFSIEDMADDVNRTLFELGHERAAVVGMSMGGCVAQALAIRHPERVRALGLVDTTAWYGPTAPDDWAARAATAADRGMRALSEFQLTRWFSDRFRADNPQVCADLLEVFAANDLPSYVASCHAMGAFDARAAISAVSVPTAVVVGELDEATPPAMAEDLHQRIRGSSLHVIPGSKHLTAHERALDVVEALAPVLAG
jgi:3-oxoadipate enol-lactonase